MNMNWCHKTEYAVQKKKKNVNRTTSDMKVNKANWRKKRNSRSHNPPRKTTLVLEDSIVKHVTEWRLNKPMRYTVSLRSVPGATSKAMTY